MDSIQPYPNSPTLPANEGIVTTAKQFSDGLTMDLTDEEISHALQITLRIKTKWENTFRAKVDGSGFTAEKAMKLVDEMEKELVDELATKLDIIATIDASPVFYGEPLIIEFVGALDSHSSAKYGMDHERKSYEVRKANERGESFLGESQLDV